MLHWPDSMVSYIPEEKLLISNDIFGQNIASSARFADDFGDDGEFVKRIKEYFYNIILPYSPMVLKTLPVVEKLDIDMIAPDHGLIHRGEKAVRFIIDMYRNLAEQKPQQRALIFYDTMWQSTERMAYAACSGLEENGVPTRIMSVKHNHHSAVMTELADCGAVLAGSPTHNNTVLPLVAAQLTYMKGCGRSTAWAAPSAPTAGRRSAQISPGTAGRYEYGHARRSREVQLGSGQGRIPRLP